MAVVDAIVVVAVVIAVVVTVVVAGVAFVVVAVVAAAVVVADIADVAVAVAVVICWKVRHRLWPNSCLVYRYAIAFQPKCKKTNQCTLSNHINENIHVFLCSLCNRVA